MRREAENRAEKFIKKRLLKKRLAGMLLVMSLIVGSVTMYMLKHSAVAVSDEAAEEVGMVMEGENDSDGGEEIVVEEMENDQAEENSAEETDGSESHGSEPEQNEAEESDENSVAEESSNEENKENSDETSGEEVTEGSNEESSEESVPTEEAQESSEVSLEAGAEKQLESSSGSNDTDESSVSNNTSEEKESTEDNEKQVVSDNEASGEGSSQEEDVEKTVSDNTASDEAASNDSDEKSAVSDNNTEKESASDNSVSNNDAKDDSTSDNGVSNNRAEDNSVSDNSVSDNSVSNNSVSGNSVSGNTVSDDSVSKNAVKTEYVYEDSKVKVVATLERADAIPDEAEFKVTEVTKTTKDYNYDAYMDALNEGVSDNKVSANSVQYDESNTLLYDIAFISDGKEVEPKEGFVSISAEFKKNQLTEDLSVEDKEDIAVIHLPIKEEVKESTEITATQTATQISSNDIEVKELTETTVEVSDSEKIQFSEDSFSVYAITVYQSHEAGTDNFKTVLGDAINYGITADTFSLGGDSQTNFAAGYVSSATHQTGNNLTNEAEQTFMIGSIASGYTLNYRGGSYPAYFLIPSKYSKQLNNSGNNNTYFKVDTSYSSEAIKKDVSDMLSYAKAASKELASRSQTAWLSYSNSKWVLDIRNKPDGTYYVTMNESDMEKIAEADKLRIYKHDGQTIVFNVTSSETINMYKYSVNGLGSDSMLNSNSYSKTSETIIWNFTKATTINANGSVVGTFIAPTSVWYNYATSAGWLVAKTAYIYSGEWHNIYNGVKQISGTVVFEAYKNIDGSAAKASGFEFTLYQKKSGKWAKIETVKNDRHNIAFSPITYSKSNTSLKKVGSTQDFIYKISETAGTKDSHGNAYIADSTEYFAKVTVTLKNNGKNYYTVSEPVYYTDESCKNRYTAEDRPVFNNMSGNGSVTLKLFKYLNKGDPGNNKYKFTVRVLKSDGSLQKLTDSLENNGKDITFTTQLTSAYLSRNGDASFAYFVITENDLSDDKVTKDSGYIIAKVINPMTDKQSVEYYKHNEAEDESMYVNVKRLEDAGYPNKAGYLESLTKRSAYRIGNASDVAFYNEGKGNLRIHKMVVNDYGTKMVRDATNDKALLDMVKFRVTNNDTGNYIVFRGFTGKNQDKVGWAEEYDKDTHKPTKKTYSVAYNNNAQWTLIGIPAGTYTVDEVADGYTFTYDPDTNKSSFIDNAKFCRVTKYDLTVDKEGRFWVGTGGTNYRKVFSVDLENHNNTGPTNVKVGDMTVDNDSHTETVQVCNYYSIPVGPVVINKNFNSKDWESNLSFSFNIEPIGYIAHDSEGNDVTLSSQPMPDITKATVTRDSAVLNGNVWSATASFGAIPFRCEGTYKYKITEVNEGKDGITYDSAVYYLEIVVQKDHTYFSKTYSYENMTNPEKYTSDTTLDEDFYYLRADITYSDKKDMSHILAKEKLYLGNNPDTSEKYDNHFIEEWDKNYSNGAPAFKNTRSGILNVKKVWLDDKGKDDSKSYTSLKLKIMRKTAASNSWEYYKDVELYQKAGWTATVENLEQQDSNGNDYIYCVKEDDAYSKTHVVIYSYNGHEYFSDQEYEIKLDDTGLSYGSVTVTNKKVVTTVLPATGGIGTLPFKIIGMIMLALSVLGYEIHRKKLKNING